MEWATQHLGGWIKVAGIAAYNRKISKKYKENKGKKQVEGEGEIRKGERRRENGSSSIMVHEKLLRGKRK
jgi:hypothetical protein